MLHALPFDMLALILRDFTVLPHFPILARSSWEPGGRLVASQLARFTRSHPAFPAISLSRSRDAVLFSRALSSPHVDKHRRKAVLLSNNTE